MVLNYIIQSDPILESHRLYRIRQHHEALEHIEMVRLYKPIYMANYRLLHKEHLVNYAREYRLKQKLSPEDIQNKRTYHKEYRRENKEKLLEYARKYRLKKDSTISPNLIFID